MAAPKGNKFAIGNDGRSKKFESAEVLQGAIDQYFKECDENSKSIRDKKSGQIIEIPLPLPYTIEGLCEVLDCDRHTLLNYQKTEGYEEFFATIKRAKNKIARNKIERGHTGESVASVAIFDLKNNHGYSDKSELEVTDKGKMTKEELEKKLEQINKELED